MLFITGGTGFVGSEILRRKLLAGNEEIALLVRGRSSSDVELRGGKILRSLFGDSASLYSPRVRIIPGDIELENFGLASIDFDKLASQITSIFHCAASTELVQKLDSARRVNVGGTLHTLQLAERCLQLTKQAPRFFHTSTAYVVGDTVKTVSPQEFSLNKSFRNSYEQSKAEAEEIVIQARGRFPSCIFRPSVIVGDSQSGYTSSFNVLYIPARWFMTGLLNSFPATPDAPFDVVPIDYVADAMVELSELNESMGKSYHICAGVGRESSPAEILHFIIRTLETYYKHSKTHLLIPKLVSPDLVLEFLHLTRSSLQVACERVAYLEKRIEQFLGRPAHWLRHAMPFLPYVTRNPRFDTSATESALTGILPLPPLFQNYAERLFNYCLKSNWGKIPLPLTSPTY